MHEPEPEIQKAHPDLRRFNCNTERHQTVLLLQVGLPCVMLIHSDVLRKVALCSQIVRIASLRRSTDDYSLLR